MGDKLLMGAAIKEARKAVNDLLIPDTEVSFEPFQRVHDALDAIARLATSPAEAPERRIPTAQELKDWMRTPEGRKALGIPDQPAATITTTNGQQTWVAASGGMALLWDEETITHLLREHEKNVRAALAQVTPPEGK